ncbi:unnamed protein product, partial [Iphiclides podalirius]
MSVFEVLEDHLIDHEISCAIRSRVGSLRWGGGRGIALFARFLGRRSWLTRRLEPMLHKLLRLDRLAAYDG